MALRGRWRSYAALVAILKGINGVPGGYYFDVGQRVYGRLIRPEDGEGLTLPYFCVPLVDATPTYETTDSGEVKCTWRQSIFWFVGEQRRGLETDISELTLKVHDDLHRSVLLNPRLSGTAQNTQWVSGGGELAAVLPGEEYGEGEAVLEIWNWYAAADLGPAATA